ncbi:zinc finger protein 271-like [Cydia splendana]|uniref:zinc finger protein 271-like n=1 Tax=Cydia splendana TaxID=1100963 RepID=UPI00300D651A
MNTIKEETSNPSLKLLSCRACLATDIKLFNIYENKLAESFAHITGSPVLLSDGLPQHLCCYCRSALLKCRVFRARSLRAQQCLRAVPLQIELTTDYIRTIDHQSHQLIYLTQTRVETTDYRDILEVDVKKEESDIDNFIPESDDLKIEYEIKDKIDEGIDNGDFSDDNTEQIFVATNPVRDVKVRKGKKKKTNTEEKRVKKKIKKRTSDNDYLPDFDFAKFESSYSVEIIALTKEQQLEEIRARKQSANYQYAAYKCEECGKGFMANDAYNNHKIRHSPSMGAHACEICLVRFKRQSRRQEHQDLHRLKFLCKECSFVSRNRYQAKKHFEWHSGKIHVCKHCGASFTKSSTYLSHVRLQHPAMNVACDVCGETFVGRLGLLQHKSRAHQVGSPCEGVSSTYVPLQHTALNVACDVCGETFVGRLGLLQHKSRAHQAESRCAECGAQFESAEALTRHTPCDPHARPCLVCGETLSTEEELQAHAKERHSMEQFKCVQCDKTFASSKSYEVHHQRVHLNVRWRKSRDQRARRTHSDPPKRKEAMCEVCGKACEVRSTRYIPLSTLLPYDPPKRKEAMCEVCGKACERKSRDQRARRTHSDPPKRKEAMCEVCGKACERPAQAQGGHVRGLRQGVRARRTHSDPPKRKEAMCEVCGKACESNAALVYHQRSHTGERPYKCAQCPKSFTMPQALINHQLVHSDERPYMCSACPKAFKQKVALQLHSRVHTGERPYKCSLCDSSFKQGPHLRTHVKLMHHAPDRRPRRKL